MQPSSSISSNLVTLSVHDSLTFDGVEIAINPDVFITKGSNGASSNGQHSRNTSFQSNATPFSSLQPPSPILPSNSIASPIVGTPVPGQGFTNDDSSTIMRSAENATIQPGDIIEIKVWDKKPNQVQSSPDGKGKNNLSVSGSSKLLAKAASALQPQIPSSSIFHPLSDPNRERTKSSSRPPIVPRVSSSGNAAPSSLVASPKHSASSPNASTKLSLSSRKSGTLDGGGIETETEMDRMPSVPLLLKPKHLSDGFHPESGSQNRWDVTTSRLVEGVDSSEGDVVEKSSSSIDKGLGVIEPSSKDLVELSELPTSTHEGSHSRISSLGSSASHGDDGYHSKVEDPFEAISKTHNLRLRFVAEITDKSLKALKAGGRTQISILRQVADLYELSSYDMVTITKFDKKEEANVQSSCQADYVTMTIKDQFISRGEMYQFQHYFLGKWIYAGERLTSEGIRGTVMDIRNGNEEIKSGFITEDTKITCRSRSARIIWLVQISSEMWDFTSPYEGSQETGGALEEGGCEIYFDKFVSFALKLFEEWKALEASHSLTVVFFSRTFITPNKSSGQALNLQGRESETIRKDVDGRLYEDYFKVVIENETRADWESLVTMMKKAFIRYPSEAGWKLTSDYSRLPSFAAQGNILEAINTALNMLQLHFIDRDLQRCGNSILFVSPGSGVFEVDKGLAGITKQRMMDNGIGSDLLSLGLPPLHLAPFMLFKETADSHSQDQDASNDFDNDWRAYFEIPHWMHLSYVNYDNVNPKQPYTSELPSSGEVDTERPKFKTLANGFIVHDKKSTKNSIKRESSNRHLKGLPMQKHLVLGRDFEDILEACRPRNRGSSTGGTPPALLSQLKLFGLVGGKNRTDISNIIEESSRRDQKEWNSLDLDQPELSPAQSLSAGNNVSGLQTNHAGSNSDLTSYSSTPSSVFANNLTMILGKSPGNIHHASPSLKYIQIQQAPSLDIPPETITADQGGVMIKTSSQASLDNADDVASQKCSRSNSVVSSCGSSVSASYGNEKLYTLEAMIKAMDAFDESVQYHEPELENVEVETSRHTQGKPLIKSRNNSHNSLEAVPTKSGIGAAINEFETKPVEKIAPINARRNESFAVSRLKKSMVMSSNNLYNIHARPSSLAYTLDDHDVLGLGLGLSVSRHGVSALSRSPNPSMYIPTLSSGLRKSKSNTSIEEENVISASPPTHKELNTASFKHAGLNYSPVKERRSKSKTRTRRVSRAQRAQTSHHSRGKQWVLNPFRQQDEEEILAKRTHNSRRWSHVFPQGEIEFKRRAGPNWKSLIQPAILPVTIDVYPTQKELEDESKYSFRHYQLNLDAMDLTYYTNHSELLMEMVRQRIVQGFQLAPQSPFAKRSDDGAGSSDSNNIRHVLSMGHRFHIISFNSASDSVEVVDYIARNATNKKNNTFKYHYNIWMPATERYHPVSQTFQRFPEEYPWNRLDNLICGDPDKTLGETTKYRRITFCIIPDQFSERNGEEAFIKKMMRFIEFLAKLSREDLQVQILSASSKNQSKGVDDKDAKKQEKTVGFILHSRKREKYEWIEFVVNKVWDTRKTFRIALKWLVSSAVKVDAQVQMIQRRCSQYGLHVVIVPEVSSQSNVFLNPLMRPESICVSDPKKAAVVERGLLSTYGFCDDGTHAVFPKDVEKTFGTKISANLRRPVDARQYFHRSGTLFVRILLDTNQSVTFIFLENRKLIDNNSQMQAHARSIFRNIIADLTAPEQWQ